MKKSTFLLCSILLLTPLNVLPLDATHFTKEILNTPKRPRCSRIDMSRTSSSPRARSTFQHLLAFQFPDKLEIIALIPFSVSIEIIDKEGNYIYKKYYSVNKSEKITININDYKIGEYLITAILTNNDYYSGKFFIE